MCRGSRDAHTGGLEVELGGVRGFCPVSQVELGYCAEPASYVGRTLEFVVTQVDDKRRSVVLSRRELLRRAAAEEAKQRLAALKVGDELDGTVRKLEAFGAFVDLGGVDGLVHVSEIRHERLAHPRDVLREGEKVRVKVLRIEPGKDGRTRIALSIRATAPDPWTEVATQFSPGQRVQGRVARLAEFGAFVTLAPGIDGLVHVSELAPQRVERVKDVIQVRQEVEALVQSVDPAKRRISLSIKALNAPDDEAASAPRERAPRESASRDRVPRDRAPRDRAPRDRAPRDRASRESASRARVRESTRRERAPRGNAPERERAESAPRQRRDRDRRNSRRPSHRRRRPTRRASSRDGDRTPRSSGTSEEEAGGGETRQS
jgi:predicted RNA-binding protein with RPS1 domain